MRIFTKQFLFSLALSLSLHCEKLYAQVDSNSLQTAISSYPASVQNFYRLRSFQPIWINANARTTNLDSWSELLKYVPAHGLNPNIYFSFNDLNKLTQLSANDLIRFELQSTQGYLALADHLQNGRIDPKALPRVQFTKKTDLNLNLLNAALDKDFGTLASTFSKLTPSYVQYQRLSVAMAQWLQIRQSNSWIPIYETPETLSLGSNNKMLVAIKTRLRLHGYPITNIDTLFDEQTANAIKDIEFTIGLTPTGKLRPGSAVWKYFKKMSDRLADFSLSLERLRWLPSQLENQFIFVNLAQQNFRLFELNTNPTNPVLSFRTVNGRPDRQTIQMRDSIRYLVLNPTWTVPNSIVAKDKAPMLARLRSNELQDWFTQKGFGLVDLTSDSLINPLQVNWSNVTETNQDFLMVQQPSYDNALGVVKFMLGNPWAIYLHDTNMRDLFATPNRQQSSGCVRLEKPLDLASYLLKGTDWTPEKLNSVLVKPNEIGKKEVRVDLKSRMPVYITYVRAEVGDDGILRFANDNYEQDKLLLPLIQNNLP